MSKKPLSSPEAAPPLNATAAPPLDRRRHAWRPDLADAALQGRVEAERFTDGHPAQVIHPIVRLVRRPDAATSLDTEVLFGERVTVFDERDGWVWLKTALDGYVGYARADAFSTTIVEPTHMVRAVGTFVYPAANNKLPPLMHIGLNSPIRVVGESGPFFEIAGGGFVVARHVAPLGQPALDYVEIAERFLGTPYLWGGRSRIGLDCSGLLQLAMHAAGIACPRDSDMQFAEIKGRERDPADLDGLARGDVLFWPGHVGIMIDDMMLLHANGHHMSTVVEPVAGVVERIVRFDNSPAKAIRRPDTGRAVGPTPA